MMRRTKIKRGGTRTLAFLGLGAVGIALAIGYVAFNALEGLPFQPKYRVAVEVPSANRLLPTNEVRVAGIRVGQVERVEAIPGRSGRAPIARVHLALDHDFPPLPVDTSARIRPASVLGATYVQLTPGQAQRTLADGQTLRQPDAVTAVDVTDLFDIFDRSSRGSFVRAVRGQSDALVGRGSSLNAAIGSFSRLLPDLTKIAGALAEPEAGVARFINAYESSFSALAPVRGQLAESIDAAAQTFAAMTAPRGALADAISEFPGTELAVTESFDAVRPGLRDLALLARDLRPAGRLLDPALARANVGLRAGVEPLQLFPEFSQRLDSTLIAVDGLAQNEATTRGLLRLSDLVPKLGLTFEDLAVAQIHCNIIALGFQGQSSFWGSMGSGHGPSIGNATVATTGAATDGTQEKEPAPDWTVNYTPNVNAQECEPGNEPDTDEQLFTNPAGLQSTETRDTSPPPFVLERARAAGLISDQGSGR